MLYLIDKIIAQHFTEYPVPPGHCPVVESLGPVIRWPLGQDRQIRHLGKNQILGVLAEIGECRRLHPECISSERDLVEIEFKNLRLG